jgi:hypothetical protein
MFMCGYETFEIRLEFPRVYTLFLFVQAPVYSRLYHPYQHLDEMKILRGRNPHITVSTISITR